MKKATFQPSLINKLTFTLSLGGRRFHWVCFIILFMVASGRHSFFIKPHLDPVGNNHTQHLVNHHKIKRKYVMLQNYLRILKNKTNFHTPYIAIVFVPSHLLIDSFLGSMMIFNFPPCCSVFGWCFQFY